MLVQNSGMRRVLHLRDGDSERGSGIQRGKRLDWEGHKGEEEIEHKALLPQVQALYTRATYYLVSNYKAVSHQA